MVSLNSGDEDQDREEPKVTLQPKEEESDPLAIDEQRPEDPLAPPEKMGPTKPSDPKDSDSDHRV